MVRRGVVAFVVSRYHYEYTSKLEQGARELLEGRGIGVEVFYVPGAFEIPLQVQRVALRGRYAAIVAFGLIWQGSTLHAQEILRVVTDSLMKISLRRDIPVVHEVLFVKNDAQARERCGGKLDRGREAAEVVMGLLSCGER
jgi:6,7-dimethyl-8-ribityllumazine synthase